MIFAMFTAGDANAEFGVEGKGGDGIPDLLRLKSVGSEAEDRVRKRQNKERKR